MTVKLLNGVIRRYKEKHEPMMTTGPRCDYLNCSRHSEQVDNRIPNRNRYCSIDCRNDEIKRRLREHEAKKATV